MEIGKYILRSLRYIARMVVLLGIVFAVMALIGVLETQDGNLFRALLFSRNGMILLGMLIILAGMYPRLSFGQVTLGGELAANREKIKEVMEQYGFVLARQDENMMVFHAGKLSRRILSQFDDTVTVTGWSGRIYLEGMKKDIFRLEGRLRSALDTEE